MDYGNIDQVIIFLMIYSMTNFYFNVLISSNNGPGVILIWVYLRVQLRPLLRFVLFSVYNVSYHVSHILFYFHFYYRIKRMNLQRTDSWGEVVVDEGVFISTRVLVFVGSVKRVVQVDGCVWKSFFLLIFYLILQLVLVVEGNGGCIGWLKDKKIH